MTAREKRLSFLVGGVVALIANYLLIEFFVKNQSSLRADLARQSADLQLKRLLFEDKALWEKRSNWLQSEQPKLVNEATAGVTLLNELGELAKKSGVEFQAPAINSPEKQAYWTSVSVNFETRSSWAGLCAFLREAQGPGRFIVFENAALQVDESDKTRMRGRFRCAKWFAPH